MTTALTGAVKSCTACSLRGGCTAPVPGVGPDNAKVMFVGEAPGEKEDSGGHPFVGQSGKYLDSLLYSVGLSRDDVYITNVVKCRPVRNATPSTKVAAFCGDLWLSAELNLIHPEIIVALGGTAATYLLGGDDTMEHIHGKPRWGVQGRDPGTIILPTYHPAFTFRDTKYMRQLQEDFQVLGGLLAGHPPSKYTVQDDYPDPVYQAVQSKEAAAYLLRQPEYALDLETTANGLWSVQVSSAPGTGWFIPASMMPFLSMPETSLVIVHNYLHDCNYLHFPRFADTMVAAYLLGLPQGLKELASRLCGMEMQSYDDLVRPGRRLKAIEYLERAAQTRWSPPNPVEESEWSNKLGKIVTRLKKPQHINAKIKARLAKTVDDAAYDPYKAWYDIEDSERWEVEHALGVMPDVSLADIEVEKALYYSSRDADATWRVWLRVREMLEEVGNGAVPS